MAKKRIKKFLKNLAKVGTLGALAYGATKLGRKRATDPASDALAKAKKLLTSNAAYRGIGRQSDGMDLSGATHRGGIIPEDYNINPNAFAAKGGRIGAKGGGIAKRGMGAAFKSGGTVKSMGIAKRGGGIAKR